MEIPTFEQLERLAPITTTILLIVWLTAWGVLRIVQRHIKTLKEFIKYLQEEIEKGKR